MRMIRDATEPEVMAGKTHHVKHFRFSLTAPRRLFSDQPIPFGEFIAYRSPNESSASLIEYRPSLVCATEAEQSVPFKTINPPWRHGPDATERSWRTLKTLITRKSLSDGIVLEMLVLHGLTPSGAAIRENRRGPHQSGVTTLLTSPCSGNTDQSDRPGSKESAAVRSYPQVAVLILCQSPDAGV